jgi:hypothetical protein
MVNQIDPDKGLVTRFIDKDSIEYISRIRIGGRMGNTSIVYRTKKNKKAVVSVFEEPQHIMNKLTY